MEVEEYKTLTTATTTAAETTTATAETTGDKKRPLDINFDELLSEDRDEPVEKLVVVSENSQRKQRRRKRKSNEDGDPPPSSENDYSCMSEFELKSKIESQEQSFAKLHDKLPDGGAKIKAKVKVMKDELERRRNRRSQELIDGYKKTVQSEIPSIKGDVAGSKQASSEASSDFGKLFLNKLDNANPKLGQNTSDQGSIAFSSELSSIIPCDKSKRAGGKLQQNKKGNPGLLHDKFDTWKPRDSSRGGKRVVSNGKLAARDSIQRQKSSSSFSDEDDSKALDSNSPKNDETVVLVDEDDTELIERKQNVKEIPSRFSECKIYYPSREDPESLEIFRSELRCLEPGECLTSTIMNFYVRFLQEGCSDLFYFFNTYFYNKLQEAVQYQQSDKEAFFMKFRRWWKGVNIFQKAYIFLPINEDNHWSLVIICVPDKEGESGLIILHLDSLGLHSSSSIFDNIKSFLINEWKILYEDVGSAIVPLPEKTWTKLPDKIEHKSIKVPRQNNDYDCGLFVLYYMERFIDEAPERLPKQVYSMFGKNWFKPQEASSLRKKIRRLLLEKFHEELQQDNRTFVPVCLSTKAEPAKTIDCTKNADSKSLASCIPVRYRLTDA